MDKPKILKANLKDFPLFEIMQLISDRKGYVHIHSPPNEIYFGIDSGIISGVAIEQSKYDSLAELLQKENETYSVDSDKIAGKYLQDTLNQFLEEGNFFFIHQLPAKARNIWYPLKEGIKFNAGYYNSIVKSVLSNETHIDEVIGSIGGCYTPQPVN